jgi:RNA polymerase sigma-70 factor (ECF subfamily)
MSARVGAAQADGADGINDSMDSLRAQVEGDRAFERLYRKYVSDVYRYALALVRSEADAEDVTQTTFLNAFRAYQRGDRPRKDKSWLLAIAHNVCRQRFRHQSRRPQEVELDEDLAEAAVPEEGPSADDLVRALQQLSFNQRSALVMRELEGRPYAEIGEILELPISAVETLLFRARRALREQLESSITCGEAEHLLSLQLDGRLARTDRGALRAHLRSCQDCSRAARSQRAQRAAWKSLAVVPLPGSLSSLLGAGGTTAVGIGTGVAVKVAALGASAALVGGGAYVGLHYSRTTATHDARQALVVPVATQAPQSVAKAPVGAATRRSVVTKTPEAGPSKAHARNTTEHGQAVKAGPQTTTSVHNGGSVGHGHSGQSGRVGTTTVAPGQAKKATQTPKVKLGAATAPKSAKKKKKVTTTGKHSTSKSSTGATTTNGQGQANGKTNGQSNQQTTPTSTQPTRDSTPSDHPSKR